MNYISENPFVHEIWSRNGGQNDIHGVGTVANGLSKPVDSAYSITDSPTRTRTNDPKIGWMI